MVRSDSLWVFGYGSLCWNPGFQYSDAKIGYITGHQRKFWQGNEYHRGTPDKLGRVVTLVDDPDPEAKVWGKAFKMENYSKSKAYLDEREAFLGGYICKELIFYPREDGAEAVTALVYIATPDNSQYLGDASLAEIAETIATSAGKSGPNYEYLAKLAAFMRALIPECIDDHLFQLELATKQFLVRCGELDLLRRFSMLEMEMIVGHLEESVTLKKVHGNLKATATSPLVKSDVPTVSVVEFGRDLLPNMKPLLTMQRMLMQRYIVDCGHRYTDAPMFRQLNAKRPALKI